jgi:thymidine kinase
MNGRIELIIGPMFAGKSTELLRRLRRYTVGKKVCKRIKHEDDNLRVSSSGIVTHDEQISGPAESLSTLMGHATTKEFLEDVDVIGIDEGQFFPDIEEYAEYIANIGKIVIIAALDSTFERKPFVNITNLVAVSEIVTKLAAVCYNCSNDAFYSKRINKSMDLVLVGGSKDYVASCRVCFDVAI